MDKQLFHFEPPYGWINDPNGLCFFNGKYHVFYQHNPYSLKWDKMHWGHAVSDDLIHFEYRPIALAPDMPYENSGGCFSGSAVVKDGKLFLFYTSVSKELGFTQSIAFSEDGETFYKYADNPIIDAHFAGSSESRREFRDPKVNYFDGKYYMVTSDSDGKGTGMICLRESDDLIHWGNMRYILSDKEFGPVIECPDFYKEGDKYILTFSLSVGKPYRVITLIGNFDGSSFTAEKRFDTESGPDYYAPQSFEYGKRRISFGWITPSADTELRSNKTTGALTVAREVTYKEGILRPYPIDGYKNLLMKSDPHVIVEENTIKLFDGKKIISERHYPKIESVDILRDLNIIEVFINKGEYTSTFWYSE